MLPTVLQASATERVMKKKDNDTSMDHLLDKASKYLRNIGYDTDTFENVEGHV